MAKKATKVTNADELAAEDKATRAEKQKSRRERIGAPYESERNYGDRFGVFAGANPRTRSRGEIIVPRDLEDPDPVKRDAKEKARGDMFRAYGETKDRFARGIEHTEEDYASQDPQMKRSAIVDTEGKRRMPVEDRIPRTKPLYGPGSPTDPEGTSEQESTGLKKGGNVKAKAKAAAHKKFSRGGGIEVRGKTKGRFV